MSTKFNESIIKHITSLSDDARQDIATGQWDEVMTDALYAACGAETREEMADARSIAQDIVAEKQTGEYSPEEEAAAAAQSERRFQARIADEQE